MKRWNLLLHTVRYLKCRQLCYQVYYRVRKPKLRVLPAPVQRQVLSDWPGKAFMPPATEDGRTFTFLGQTARLENDWNGASFPKLWLYNLHYQDDLNAAGAVLRPELCGEMVDRWIAGNPPLHGNGWEPYCLSLRIVNWVKFFCRLVPDQVKREWLQSLSMQTDVLEQRLEFHILANHLFVNAKALVFAGTFLGGEQGDRCLARGLKLLDAELREQFLDDGGHFERSPMYHATLLWDVADLLALAQAAGLPSLAQRVDGWKALLMKGLQWLQLMVHPDGEISFFNDATIGIAPDLQHLSGYCKQLGIKLSSRAVTSKLKGDWLQSSGYGVIDWPGSHRLLVDVAPVGPDYQPGHAHADTLSCELSLFDQRVLVNSGISQYGEDKDRHRQRSTSAHNTVEVDGENSSEVWAGFRVARRARPFGVSIEHGLDRVALTASHDGYHRLPGKVTHRRCWTAHRGALVVEDTLEGKYQRAVAHWHFHPDVQVEQVAAERFRLTLPNNQVAVLSLSDATAELQGSTWHPAFGCSISNQKLSVEFAGSVLETRIKWSPV